ncbi:hypothetical protein ACWC1D_06710 [Streptomyces sp. NPDC001478]
MSWGLIEVGVVGLAVLLRLTAFGWLALIAIAVSALSLGLLPAILFGPLLYAGFAGPPEAWPLLAVADRSPCGPAAPALSPPHRPASAPHRPPSTAAPEPEAAHDTFTSARPRPGARIGCSRINRARSRLTCLLDSYMIAA